MTDQETRDRVHIKDLLRYERTRQILLTGEIDMMRVGGKGADAFRSYNRFCEREGDGPFVVLSEYGTWRMPRFSYRDVWPLVGDELLFDMFQNESDWLGYNRVVKPVNNYDYHETLFRHIRETGEKEHGTPYLVPVHVDRNTYSVLAAALWFNKRMFDVHIPSFFAKAGQMLFSRIEFFVMPVKDRERMPAARAVSDYPTEAEIDFIDSLYIEQSEEEVKEDINRYLKGFRKEVREYGSEDGE
jgi:hypothetical protein